MITEWQIQSFSRRCAHSNEVFKPGDRVTCLLIETVSEGLIRMDVLEQHSESINIEGTIVGRWVRTIKPPEEGDSEARKQQAQSVEELFVSMTESVSVDIRSNSSKCMVYILALFLERKRIIKSIPTRGIPQNYLNFRHIKSKKEYLVEVVDMNPENMDHIEKNLNILGGSVTSDAGSNQNTDATKSPNVTAEKE